MLYAWLSVAADLLDGGSPGPKHLPIASLKRAA